MFRWGSPFLRSSVCWFPGVCSVFGGWWWTFFWFAGFGGVGGLVSSFCFLVSLLFSFFGWLAPMHFWNSGGYQFLELGLTSLSLLLSAAFLLWCQSYRWFSCGRLSRYGRSACSFSRAAACPQLPPSFVCFFFPAEYDICNDLEALLSLTNLEYLVTMELTVVATNPQRSNGRWGMKPSFHL